MGDPRDYIGKTDDGDRVFENHNGDKYTIDKEDVTGIGGLFEVNHEATDAEIEQAEQNGL